MDHAALTGLPLTSPTSGTNELGSQGESSGRSTPSSDSAPGKLFVGGLSWQTSQDKLREYFGQFGNVTDVLVMKDPITQVVECLECLVFPEPQTCEEGGRRDKCEDNRVTFRPFSKQVPIILSSSPHLAEQSPTFRAGWMIPRPLSSLDRFQRGL